MNCYQNVRQHRLNKRDRSRTEQKKIANERQEKKKLMKKGQTRKKKKGKK